MPIQLLRADLTVWHRLQQGDEPLATSVAEALKTNELSLIRTTTGLIGWSAVGPRLSETHLLEIHLPVQLKLILINHLGVRILRRRRRRQLLLRVIGLQGRPLQLQ